MDDRTEPKELQGRTVKVFLRQPEGYKYEGKVLSSHDGLLILLDQLTRKEMAFPLANIQRLEVLNAQ